MAYFL